MADQALPFRRTLVANAVVLTPSVVALGTLYWCGEIALRPALFWTFDEAVQAGLRRVIVVTNPDKPTLELAARTYPHRLALDFVPQ